MKNDSQDKFDKLHKEISDEVKEILMGRLYGSGEKIYLSKDEKISILNQIKYEVDKIVELEKDKLESGKTKVIEEIRDKIDINLNDKVNKAKNMIRNYIYTIIFVFTLGGILTYQSIRNMAAEKAAKFIVEESNLKNLIINTVTDSLSKQNNDIIRKINMESNAFLEQLHMNALSSDSLFTDLQNHHNQLINESMKKFDDVILVLDRVEKKFK
ncbi:hypothetical protein JXO52_06295 [bacterium]|nr:hypothetical protein [bacterium]